jgi:hypothetical protein
MASHTVQWGIHSDRAICTGQVVEALRGGEGGTQVPMARGSNLVSCAHHAYWDIKLIGKSSIHGDIYIGIETVESPGKEKYLIGQDWFNLVCEGRTFYYSSDGVCCSGNKILCHTSPFKVDDIIGLQLENCTLKFTKNGETVAVVTDIQGFARAAIQMHRPGDKLQLLREFVGSAAAKRICQFKAAELQREDNRRKTKEAEEAARQLALEAQKKRQDEENAARALVEEEQRRAQALLAAQRLRAAADAAQRQEEDAHHRRLLEHERALQLAERRARLAKEEAARKKAAQLQIQKVARARGFCQEIPDPDAPSDREIRDFLRDCLPLRLVAARQRGRPTLPGLADVADMELLLTPQQHHAVCSHLTARNKACRAGAAGAATTTAAPGPEPASPLPFASPAAGK